MPLKPNRSNAETKLLKNAEKGRIFIDIYYFPEQSIANWINPTLCTVVLVFWSIFCGYSHCHYFLYLHSPHAVSAKQMPDILNASCDKWTLKENEWSAKIKYCSCYSTSQSYTKRDITVIPILKGPLCIKEYKRPSSRNNS